MALVKADLGEALPLIASGKVRELYDVDSNTLLFVATDRISAYDVIMQNGIPDKGLILTLITAHWFDYLEKHIPGLKTHFISLDLPPAVPRHLIPQLKGRSMLVHKLKVFPVEAIVRGYITGSAWSSYKKTGEVNGKKMPQDLQESQELPEPIYTPSTKAELGQHDENISTEQAAQIVGEKYAKRIEELSLSTYKAARDHAKEKGIIIADTKFEFGLDEATDEVVLVDEVLTPDSSRFWSKETYKVGQSQDSFDKQFLRDWLTKNGLKGKEGVTMPQDVVDATRAKYLEAFKILTGKTLEETLQELK
ncbi:Bifunctional purine biosynthetic protein ade1 [Exophiala dermatitidis]|uniref:Phosphoribosylaminoimidazole-succinocarboxamide synthase n=1 Tax=Exophiala dermatitidis TaxID=5970 RepID=A0AAN6IYB6_EXODE|nr:Bifunctional purine biosynthetic protein ade1 [Exophiala dermatitidis]KAJ4527889.1 Bifunctional purine biosynthetic protein ade1 [Exophiala dermatitidis]KAJ4528523.1 Bifunctional purine biosynthetic protein ade1 [Exophiala dermatitidis]KAJ4529893.1 Bifunctional purine biosynthetic protein ade1 [Exophiala dermatitidis]KAJ4552880.1 Bifunctional purine biosynthetic protein ade1 [Exophiala dermatitidis]